MTEAVKPEFAYLFPEPLALSGDFLKSTILLFDGATLLVPAYMADAPLHVNTEVTQPLHDQGLLTFMTPEEVVGPDAANALGDAVLQLLEADAFSGLPEAAINANLSLSRLGFSGDREIAHLVLSALQERGLAGKVEDGVSVPMHGVVRSTVLVLLSQLLSKQESNGPTEYLPVTDRLPLHELLASLLGLPLVPTVGSVYASDLTTIQLDLSQIPIDELLDFRSQHGEEYRRYRRDLHAAARGLRDLPTDEQAKAMKDRSEELRDQMQHLDSLPEISWRTAASLSLGLVGAAVALSAGQPISALLSVLTGIAGTEARQRANDETFGYLLAASRLR